ncbi:hypothetical protein BSL78_08872 [Apostichopus japonicus]|uniref:CCHC-type domain-containing protein n=1 Tax=Stichopus japonicus TaxID=307972 RepID=A0A2G8L212_STIJA|nr:hypothetical protein BSL78_08872 [Apostichopus japonicus]
MSEQVVVRTLGRFGKVTGYEEPEFLNVKVSRPGLDELESNSSPILPNGGHRAQLHTGPASTCWRCGLEGHEARLCPNKRCAAVYRLGIPWPSVKGYLVTRVGKRASARLCPDRSYAARVATGVVEAVPVPASDTVPPDAPVIAPVSDTSAPWRLCSPFRVRPLPLSNLPRLPACPLR